MNIKPVGKGFLELRNIRHMGQHAKLDLAVVGAEKLGAEGRNEGGADAAALFGAHRNVLQIGIGR